VLAHLRESANILRGPVDAGGFKTYMFPRLFLKRICEVQDETDRVGNRGLLTAWLLRPSEKSTGISNRSEKWEKQAEGRLSIALRA